MKKSIFAVMAGTVLTLTSMFGMDRNGGKEIFESNGCTMCHQEKMETVGPSIDKIGMYYSGKENALVSYLKGQGEPIIYPERANAMQPQLLKLRHLLEEEIRALARYLSTAYNFREDM